eukprot:TRINITY_DN13286_c0_g1_i2.p2 TRINITY_DN13286_c0_g1~~TRINITY_DN13286_c0_g1_i2.p2  ORF type:complete len:102 (+),score=34.34 TRINITY_DN13286_c0_g1_i2:103-408(+)
MWVPAGARADLDNCNLEKADCSNVDFYRANLSPAIFTEALLCGAILSEAQMAGAYFNRADLRGATFSLDLCDCDGKFSAKKLAKKCLTTKDALMDKPQPVT